MSRFRFDLVSGMKTVINFLGLFLLAGALSLSGCLTENFIPDIDNPNLPKYTEDGNQVGGALVNSVAWKTNYAVNYDGPTSSVFYFTNFVKGDSVTITLGGKYNEGPKKNLPLNFLISIKGLQLNSINEIKNLTGQAYVLDGTQNQAICSDYFQTLKTNKDAYYDGVGQFLIKNVKEIKNLIYTRSNGEKYNPLIVSGVFYFEFKSDTIKIESGRFDFQVVDSDIRFN